MAEMKKPSMHLMKMEPKIELKSVIKIFFKHLIEIRKELIFNLFHTVKIFIFFMIITKKDVQDHGPKLC